MPHRINVELVYSPDDGGWYAELWTDPPAGYRTTDCYPTDNAALDEARKVIRAEGRRVGIVTRIS